MLSSQNPDVMWLNLTNVLLGIVTLVPLLAVAGSVVVDLLRKAKAAPGLAAGGERRL